LGEAETNIPDYRVDVQQILPHPEPLNQVEEGKVSASIAPTTVVRIAPLIPLYPA